jgi:hypothetical protein
MSDVDDLAHARDFLADLDRWYDFCRANQNMTPGQLADSTAFPEDAEQARDILDSITQHADGTLRVIVRVGEDYKLVRWWVDNLLDRNPGTVRDTKRYWEGVRLTVEHARVTLELRGNGVGLHPRNAEGEEQPVEIDKLRRKSRGRPADTDSQLDKRIFDAWKSRQYKTYEELAATFAMNKREVNQAVDRERKRRKK